MKLKPYEVEKLPDGMHCDGAYLYLRVRGANRSWFVRGPRVNGRKPEMGIGSLDHVSLAQARRKRDAVIAEFRATGLDPVAEKRKAKEAQAKRKTFAEAAEAVIEKNRPGWKLSLEGNCSTLSQWRRDVTAACKPIAAKGVDEVTVDDIKRVVEPYWRNGRFDSARALIRRIEAIIDYAIAHGWRDRANPAEWKIFQNVWPGVLENEAAHHAALPWRECPEFFRRLQRSEATSARLIEFIMLTATRSTEARGATWSEINFETRVWTIPAARMKASRMKKVPEPHDVPLSEQAIALLRRMETEKVVAKSASDFVFVGGRGAGAKEMGKPMRNASLHSLVKRAGADSPSRDGVKKTPYAATTHGFRSSFRDWCGETGVDRELAERCLAHKVGNDAENAYARSQLTERRRPVMEAWGAFIGGSGLDNVVPFKKLA